MNTQLKLLTAAIMIMLSAGCTDLKPLEAQVATLNTQVTKLQSDVDGLKKQESANATATATAEKTAQEALSKAGQALAEAGAANSKAEAVDAKMDRMFKRSVSK